jgi:N-sulfoglucosamine sulfohydrolase
MRLLCTLLALLLLGSRPPAQRPNIVFIIADDVSWNDLGCYGHPVVETPRLDRLAANGLRFDQAFLTTSSCSPSRCSLISGRYPHNTGAPELHMGLPAEITAFPTALQAAGYYTAQSGKWHMGEAPRVAFDEIRDRNFGPGGEKHWLSLLEDRPQDQPFFLWLAAIDAHRGWDSPNPWLARYVEQLDRISVPPYLADTDSTRLDLARYYAEISRLDDYVGQVVDELAAQGVLENTLIVFIADNGRPFPGCKTRLYDRGIQTPMVAHWPAGIGSPGDSCRALLSTIDLAPTFLELAGAEVPTPVQGRSFARLFAHPHQAFRNYVFAEHNWHDYEALERSVRTEEFLYLLNERPQLANQGPADAVNSPSFADLLSLRATGQLNPAQAELFMQPRPREELYDVRSDPQQLVNLAAHPAYAAPLHELRAVMQAWRAETADHSPAQITPDFYDRETAARLSDTKGLSPENRGTMPGAGQGALKTSRPGPF